MVMMVVMLLFRTLYYRRIHKIILFPHGHLPHLPTATTLLHLLALLHHILTPRNSRPRQHQLLRQLIQVTHLVGELVLAWLLQLLDPIGILQRIKRILAAGAIGRDIPYHQRPAIPSKRILQHHRQLTSPKRRMILILIQRPYTLLQRQQRLINLRAINPRLLISLISMIRRPLTARQINKRHLAKRPIVPLQRNLQYRMGPRTIHIGAILRRDPGGAALSDHRHKHFDAGDPALFEADDVYVLFGVLPGEELVALVEEVEQLAAVDLVEGEPDGVGGGGFF